jgi:CYTH domain-containing protein
MATPIEIERKYVILMPDVNQLEEQDGYTVSHILQTYLESEPNVTHRVRCREYEDHTVYTETKKTRIDKISAYEEEREISEQEYKELLVLIKEGTQTLTKTRHTFLYLGQVFEIDIYPEWGRTAIMETELPSRKTTVSIPDFLNVVTEVSGDKSYSNAAMSHEFPEELVQD